MKMYEPGSSDYKAAFETLLRCLELDESLSWSVIEQHAACLPRTACAADWGAGTGRFTRKLCERFDTVYAIEPSTVMCEELERSVPEATVINGDIAGTRMPQPVDVGLISHVYYHVPDHEWAGHTLRCASQLSDGGVLFVLLKHPDTGCNRMIEAFGAPCFNLYSLLDAFRRNPRYTLKFQTVPGTLRTTSLADTLSAARFVLSDRSPGSFPQLPSEQAFERYVRHHFWDEERSAGGWNYQEIIATIERNPFLSQG